MKTILSKKIYQIIKNIINNDDYIRSIELKKFGYPGIILSSEHQQKDTYVKLAEIKNINNFLFFIYFKK